MMTLLQKILGPFALVLVGVVAGSFGTMKLQKPAQIPACPDCHCPEPSVSIQPFEVEKIKGLRNFTYAPQFSGSIRVAGVDSTGLKRMIDESIRQSLQQNGVGRRASNRFTELFHEADSVFTLTLNGKKNWRNLDMKSIAKRAGKKN